MHLLAARPSVLGLLRLRPEQNRDSAPTQTAPLRWPQWRTTQTASFPSYWPGISSTGPPFCSSFLPQSAPICRRRNRHARKVELKKYSVKRERTEFRERERSVKRARGKGEGTGCL